MSDDGGHFNRSTQHRPEIVFVPATRGTAVTLEDVATRLGHDRKYTRQILKLAFLAPDIQRAILTGRQHKSLTLSALSEADVPLLWSDQRTLLGTA